MWKQLGIGLMCLFAVIVGAVVPNRTAAIKPWYRSAAEKERAVRIGWMNQTLVQ
jgi:hypothetical protein